MFEIELFYIWMNQNKYVFKPMNNFLNKWLQLFLTDLFEIELFNICLNLNKYAFESMNRFLNKWQYLF